MSTHNVRFVDDGDEKVDILVDDEKVFSVEHGRDGWGGMETVLDAINTVVRKLGYEVHDEQDIV